LKIIDLVLKLKHSFIVANVLVPTPLNFEILTNNVSSTRE
jgi:hypothetical protein